MKKKFVCLPAFVLAACALSAKAADWYAPQQPFPVYGNTYYVGTGGISKARQAALGDAAFIDAGACRSYAANMRTILAQTLAAEAAPGKNGAARD